MTQKDFCAKYNLDRACVCRIIRDSGLRQGEFMTERGAEYSEEDLIKATRLYYHGMAARALRRVSEYEDILLRLPKAEGQERALPAGRDKEKEGYSCNNCENIRVDKQRLESYCKALEGHEIILEKGETCPPWCPKKRNLSSVKFVITRDRL